jgi:hypothetical protein
MFKVILLISVTILLMILGCLVTPLSLIPAIYFAVVSSSAAKKLPRPY